METSPASASQALRKPNRTRHAVLLFIWGVAFGVSINWSNHFLPDYQGPAWLKLGLILLPWIFLVLAFRFLRLVVKTDELEKHISREALVIAGCCLICGLIALDQLQAAGFVRTFKWTNGQLLLVMTFLLAAGTFWSKRRYR